MINTFFDWQTHAKNNAIHLLHTSSPRTYLAKVIILLLVYFYNIYQTL